MYPEQKFTPSAYENSHTSVTYFFLSFTDFERLLKCSRVATCNSTKSLRCHFIKCILFSGVKILFNPVLYVLCSVASHRRVGCQWWVGCAAGTLPDSGMTAGLAPGRGSHPSLPLNFFLLSPTTLTNPCVLKRTQLLRHISSLFPVYSACPVTNSDR